MFFGNYNIQFKKSQGIFLNFCIKNTKTAQKRNTFQNVFLKKYYHIIKITAALVINAKIHAIAHCSMTIPKAHFPPSSLFTDEIDATQGV